VIDCPTYVVIGKEIEQMTSRIDLIKVAPGVYRAMFGLERYLHDCGLETSMLDLVRMRASQINGCAFCLDMHSKDARAAGETEQRLYLLDAWREAPFYSERERAALAWTEALTLVADNHVPDEVYNEERQHFSEEELVNLSLAVIAINGWNCLAISFRSEVGGYQPGMLASMLK
jgi:AhpD family alkylhydroperoxidase